MSVQTMIEAAKAEHRYDGDTLIVVDALNSKHTTGIRVEVGPTSDGSGFSSYVYDRCGNGFRAFAPDILGSVTEALNGYLDIINQRRR